MPSLLSQGALTFTEARVEQVLRDVPYKIPTKVRRIGGPSSASSHQPSYKPIPIPYIIWTTEHEFDENANLIAYNSADRRKRAWNMVKTYQDALQGPANHLDRLEISFSKLLEFNFEPPPDTDNIVREICRLLERLPAVPPMPEIEAPPTSTIDAGFFVEGSPQLWENLKAVRFVDSNVIRLAMLIVIETRRRRHTWNGKIVEYIDLIGELFGVASEQASTSNVPNSQLSILRQFLWTGWQRVVLLNLYYTLGSETQSVNINYRERSLVLGVQLNAALRQALQSKPVQSASEKKASYMCAWAFELLRSDRAAVAQDFRAFHERYSATFGHLPPRCIAHLRPLRTEAAYKQCKGQSPTQCQRFRGMKITDQSAHAPPCRGACPRLYWSEESYRNATEGRAVSITDTGDDCLIRYCKASYTTMAISHVWSHGQGGRPEPPEVGGTGFNSCLHLRYCKIAKSLGCDSYWMDTPCIPRDHKLRHEAIMEINNVFANSKLTLVCDRDIMDIDVSDLTVERQESLLAALLVCDWNVRAWTYLESVKGRDNIYLLCKDDIALCLSDILHTVYQKGNMTIAVLFLTAQHLLPPWVHTDDQGKSKADMKYSRHGKEAMEVEDAAYNLSHRHASRPGDEVVIWSLLTRSPDVTSNALEFWKTRVGGFLPTGFLISSSPRIGYEDPRSIGFGWAPRRPDLPDRQKRWWWPQREDRSFHFAFDGVNTEHAYITNRGLNGQWISHIFDAHPPWWQVLSEWCERGTSAEHRMLRRVAAMIPWQYYWGALLMPADQDHAHSIDPVGYRGRADGTLLAVVASNGDEDGTMVRYIGRHDDPPPWHWIGVIEWPKSIPLPELKRYVFLLV